MKGETMAKSSQKLDQVFKEKLDQHSIKPSALAWERLEKELPKESKSNQRIWWAAAASVVILLSAGYFLYPENQSADTGEMLANNQVTETPATEGTLNEIPTIAEVTPKEETITQDENAQENTLEPKQPEVKKNTKTNLNKPSTIQQEAKNEAPQNLIAMTETQEETKVTETQKVEVPEVTLEKELPQPEMQITAPDLDKTIAEAQVTDEAPAYRVKIYSDGLKEKPKDKSLIAGIGKTVNEVEGLLDKVDQGFADLQDAKNNLFTSMVSKKERADK